jgi:hypothetical protein
MGNLCPKCNRLISYDPYFKVKVCRQCGWMSERKYQVEQKQPSNTSLSRFARQAELAPTK